ncbi:hypothetical protein [Microseira sp. BLCC-F43]|uniref:hypothetical protein n=1 Tax=Microseira sp. BLCC-F43 TaxID=3153602 RepID=UPI0035B74C6C
MSLHQQSLIAPPSICRDTAFQIFLTRPNNSHAVSLHHTPIALLGHGIHHLSDKTKNSHAVSLHHTPIALLGHGIHHLSDKTKN